MKNSVNAMKWNREGLWYLQQKFPQISDAKTKEGIFISPQIKELMNDRNFDEILEGLKRQCGKHSHWLLTTLLATTKCPTTDSWLRKCLMPTE
jgi:hypothetical protein